MKKKVFSSILMVLLVATSLLAGCGRKPDPVTKITEQPSVEKLKIYTTIYPMYDFTKKIGGEKVEVLNITPWGVEPHDFEPSTRLLADLTKAKLVIYNGSGMEHYIDKTKEALKDSSVLFIETSRGLDLIKEGVNDDGHDDHKHDAKVKDHEHGEFDPHTWLSPGNALKQGEIILQALLQVDPDNKPYYEANYQAFREKILVLKRDYQDTLAKCKKKEFIVSHDAFGYLAKEYGLIQIPIRGLNAESEPTPGKLKEIVKLAKKHGIKHIFFETLVSPKVSQAIAREIKGETLVLTPLDGVTETEIQNGKDYFSLMYENLENLKTALEYQP